MLKIIDREKEICARISSELAILLQRMHNMNMRDFEDCVRRINILRFKLYVIRNEKAKTEKIKDDML